MEESKMKFKVGDKVRDNIFGNGRVIEKNKNSILVQFFKKDYRLHSGTTGENGPYESKTCLWYNEETRELEKLDYTYEDLKKLPIGTKITFGNNLTLIKTRYNKLENDMVLAYIDELADLQDYRYGKIIKIEEPEYKTVYETETEILDKAEKRYLRGIIVPFKDKVICIRKSKNLIETLEYIAIELKGDSSICLPYFESNTMYKGMKLDKKYTLKELGL